MNGPDTETDMAGHWWASMAEAAELLGVSQRTIRRRISAGELAGRIVHGRREVQLGPDTPRTNRTRRVNPNAGGADDGRPVLALSVVADRAVTVAERMADDARRELHQARRWGRTGWGTAAAVLIAGGLLSALTWRQAGVSDQAAADARQRAEDMAGQVARLESVVDTERGRVDQLAGTLEAERERNADLVGQLIDSERRRAEVLAEPWRFGSE